MVIDILVIFFSIAITALVLRSTVPFTTSWTELYSVLDILMDT